MKMNGNSMGRLTTYCTCDSCAPDLPGAHLPPPAPSQEPTEERTMPLVKQASKQERTTKAATITVLGATGLGFSLLGNASASTMPAADIAQPDNTAPDQRFVLSEEEMADVSLATFHLFDKESVGRGVQLARACGGCRGCAARACRGCGVRACRGCAVRACGGCAVRACAVGCGVGCAVGSCCASWGYCRVC